jgi:hypothetical protein
MPRMGAQMLHPVTFRTLALLACGWLLAGEAMALTLGRARGAALIGRPLELVIPVTLDSSETQGPCAGADLFYGEERVRAPIVRWEPGIGMQGVVRISSPAPVDEPMVTVYLRVGCEQASSRRFVLLSELAPETEQGPVRASAPVPRPRVQRTALARPQPRLKLEPLDLGIDRDPVLRLTADIRTQPAAEPQLRQAAAALWQVLQRGPDETVQEALRLQGVERELKSLHDVTRQNVALIREMRGRVEQAEAGRKTAFLLVLALALVLAALLAWLGMRWYRVRQVERVGRWFELHGEAALAAAAAAAETGPLPLAPLPTATDGSGAKKAAAPHVISAPLPVATAGAAGAFRGEDFQAGRGAAMRMVGVEELIDVHDKADFFLSIGETEQAIAALESHVHDQVETGALAWMHLLDLYHSLGRRLEYERVRAEFAQRFGVQVPDFERFDEAGAPLESHGRAVNRIVELWPSQAVLDVIEESIFRKPGLPGGEPFTLEAYRELVLLYHIAKETLPAEQPKVPAPIAIVDERERLMIPPASARLGVDIDLEEPPADRIAAQGLDFDFSAYDDITAADPAPKRG